ncbi:uncharacterized protein LOC116027026 [Ipomoea triloba]|uniref:uncharacterized protein LOC116027026 n=1 Tax=Ipomoea triloba TaxID=35885 RepID=UPI00125E1DA9|nr:uncharacterized protein LOC116027026 [Ipomoea triloba]
MKFARANLTGEMEDYFKKFWSYYLEIQRSNPNTTSIVKTSEFIEDGGQKRFLRWYICWEACKIGFSHCRKIIGVDGCHLRSTFGGYLLTATAMDPNDGIFPIAYALAEGESKESWSWFLALLKHDLRISESEEHMYTFVSDKQKGLIPAFHSKLSHVSHRFCVRHLYSNMKVAGFHGKAIKETLWAAARATTVNSFTEAMRKMKDLDVNFTEAMRKMKDLDVNAFDWLGDKHPSEWSRSHFSTDALCDILVNNVFECFNAMILDARSYPLISCLEKMRTILMVRLFKNKEVATKCSGRICPRILRKLAVEEKYAGHYLPIQCDLMLFEITGMHTGEHHKIDLARRSCSCRKWDLTGIPCKHAICAIWMKKHNVLDYVDNCYSIETYLKVYQAVIKPMAGPNEWPMTHKEPPLPPLFKTRPGRPKKLRKTGANENSKGKTVAEQISRDGIYISRAHVPLHCTLCKKSGHNKRRCPLKPKQTANVRGNTQQQKEVPITDQSLAGLYEVEVGVDNSFQGLHNLVDIPVDIPFESQSYNMAEEIPVQTGPLSFSTPSTTPSQKAPCKKDPCKNHEDSWYKEEVQDKILDS